MNKWKIVFFIFYHIVLCFGLDLRNINYPRELDVKNVVMADFLTELSREGGITIICEQQLKNEEVDLYFIENTNYETIISSLEKTYNVIREVNDDRIIIYSKKKEKYIGNTLKGKIFDKNRNIPLKNVKIYLDELSEKSVNTNEQGAYTIENIPPGIYMVILEKEGYIKNCDFLEIKKGNTIKNFYLDRDKDKKITSINSYGTINKYENNVIIDHIILKNISLDDSLEILNLTYGDEITIAKIPSATGLVLKGNAKIVQSAKDLIDRIDITNKQVRVTAEILDIRDNFLEELGFNWLYKKGKKNEFTDSTNIGILNSSTIDSFGIINGSKIELAKTFNNGMEILNLGINLLKGTQDIKVSALPTLLLMNGKEGEFKMVEEVIVGEIQREEGESGNLYSTPLFKEAGIILKVIPEIREDNMVYLKLSLEVSDFKLKMKSKSDETDEDGTFNSKGGSKTSRLVSTHVKLNNEETILIGGLKRTIEQNLKSEVPYLSEIPYLGRLFKSTMNKKEKTDLYIKLKVEIL